jgi:hypothetical protein
MAKRIEEQGVAWIRRDGSPHRVDFTERFGVAPTVFPISAKKPLLDLGTVHIIEQHRDHFVVSVKHPLGGYDNFQWMAEGVAPEFEFSIWKALVWGAGFLTAGVGLYAALVELHAVPNVFASG